MARLKSPTVQGLSKTRLTCPKCALTLTGEDTECPKCGQTLDVEHIQELWFEEPIGEWIAAFRLIPDEGGRPQIAEVRVFPNESRRRRRDPGSWSGSEDSTPPGGLPRTVLNEIKVGRPLEYLDKILKKQAKIYGKEMIATLFGLSDGVLSEELRTERPGRGGRSDEFLAEVASIYVDLLNGPTKSPTKDLAAELSTRRNYEYAIESARQLLNKARNRGILERPARAGRPGGSLTDYGRSLLEKRGENG